MMQTYPKNWHIRLKDHLPDLKLQEDEFAKDQIKEIISVMIKYIKRLET